MINIKVNDSPHQLEESSSIETVLNKLSITSHGIAIAINQTIITKSDWNTQLLKEEDEVLIIKATQGG
jgi:sulfur carrier protein